MTPETPVCAGVWADALSSPLYIVFSWEGFKHNNTHSTCNAKEVYLLFLMGFFFNHSHCQEVLLCLSLQPLTEETEEEVNWRNNKEIPQEHNRDKSTPPTRSTEYEKSLIKSFQVEWVSAFIWCHSDCFNVLHQKKQAPERTQELHRALWEYWICEWKIKIVLPSYRIHQNWTLNRSNNTLT